MTIRKQSYRLFFKSRRDYRLVENHCTHRPQHSVGMQPCTSFGRIPTECGRLVKHTIFYRAGMPNSIQIYN
jgi:hypothetical protein